LSSSHVTCREHFLNRRSIIERARGDVTALIEVDGPFLQGAFTYRTDKAGGQQNKANLELEIRIVYIPPLIRIADLT
jgi:hypothetical protein